MPDMPVAYVHLFRGADPKGCPDRYTRGLAPDEMPYGFHLAAQHGVDVTFSEDHPRTPLQLALRLLLGFDFMHAFRNRRAIAAADAIWTMTEGEAFAVAALMDLHLVPPTPIVANAVWLADRWPRLVPPIRAIYRRLARRFTLLTAHAEPSLAGLRRWLPDAPSRLAPFGIHVTPYRDARPVEPHNGPLRIVAAGNDPTRDWQTLLDAFGNDKRFELHLAALRLKPRDVVGYWNVTLARLSGAAALADLYATADVIAVPMIENSFSGITVALEAAACLRPLLSSRTGGVPTYFAEDEAIYVPPGDAHAMRAAILGSTFAARTDMAERARTRLLREGYTTDAMIERYVAATPQSSVRAIGAACA
jgi:glycosyltransferase involved in cell wall biosynthesis